MIHQLEKGAEDAGGRGDPESENDQSDLADAGIGEHPLDVLSLPVSRHLAYHQGDETYRRDEHEQPRRIEQRVGRSRHRIHPGLDGNG